LSPTRILEVRRGVLNKNDELARDLRDRFHRSDVFVVNLVSSPGAGKTALLEWTLGRLRALGYSTAALVGDLETDNDARRLARSGVPVRQIVTHGYCHLEAQMVLDHLAGWELSSFDFLFIENVGNLVCPAGYDLGEHLRGVLLSVTEGEDKPLKYPKIINTSDFALISKIDLSVACEFDVAAARANLHQIRPGILVLETSAKTGVGLDGWITFLLGQVGNRKPGNLVASCTVAGSNHG
jgi:hydrogenase nickel incorporation protein HypB